MNQSFNRLGLLIVSASLALAMGCQQDPFADKSEQIRNGVPPERQTAPVPEKPRSIEALRIDSLDFYTFKEQIASEFTISGRVLEARGKFELSIDNLKEFPGATFDPVKGVFKWTPPRDTTGDDYGRDRRLVVRLTSPSPTGGATEATTKAILIFVTRAELDPEIIAVDDLKTVPTREGELKKFNVVVKDPDSSDIDGGRPRLLAVPSKKGPLDLSGLVYMQDVVAPEVNPQQDPTNKQQWIFKMQLDLRVNADQRGRDFTRTQDLFNFGLQATSRYGRVGMKSVDALVWTDVLKPEVSWFDPIEAVAGQENVIQFTVYDPYAEGKLSVNFVTRVDQLPGSAIQTCKVASRDGNMLCKISWKPDPSAANQDFPIEFEALNQSKVPTDTKFQKETFKRVIRVIPGQVSPPAPRTPTPAPSPSPAPLPPVTIPSVPRTTGGGN